MSELLSPRARTIRRNEQSGISCGIRSSAPPTKRAARLIVGAKEKQTKERGRKDTGEENATGSSRFRRTALHSALAGWPAGGGGGERTENYSLSLSLSLARARMRRACGDRDAKTRERISPLFSRNVTAVPSLPAISPENRVMRDAVLRLDNQREIVAAGISIRSEFAPADCPAV